MKVKITIFPIPLFDLIFFYSFVDSKENKPFTFLLRQRSKSQINRTKDKRAAENQSVNNDVDRDTPRVAPLPPQKVLIPSSSPIIQIACGLHHTALLTQNGEVFTFGR